MVNIRFICSRSGQILLFVHCIFVWRFSYRAIIHYHISIRNIFKLFAYCFLFDTKYVCIVINLAEYLKYVV